MSVNSILNSFYQEEVKRPIPYGKSEVIFKSIRYELKNENKPPENMGDFKAVVEVEKYKDIQFGLFEKDNFQLDLLIEQLGIDSHNPEELNKAAGTIITVHKFERYDDKRGMNFTNVSFNPRYLPQEDRSNDLA